MSYQKDMKATWDEYATKMTIEHDREEAFKMGFEQGMKEGKKEGIKMKSIELVENLVTNNFTIEDIVNYVNVSEAFILKVKKDMK